LFSKKDKFGISVDDFTVVKCKKCGLIYVNPRPSEQEIIKFYPETYSWKETLQAGSLFTRIVRRLEKAYRYHLLNYEVNRVLKFTRCSSGRVLDIGCGSGDRLSVFRDNGFEAYGVEISPAARYAKEKLKLDVFEGDLYKANYPGDFFDIVTMYSVLEHLHNPKELLFEVRRILKREGFLIVQVPNTESLQFRIFKDKWSAFDVPRDLYYFNISLLNRILSNSGFKCYLIDHSVNWWHPPTIVITLFPQLDPQLSWLKEKQKKNPVFKRAFWIFWTLSLGAFTFIESSMKRGAIINFYSKKVST